VARDAREQGRDPCVRAPTPASIAKIPAHLGLPRADQRRSRDAPAGSSAAVVVCLGNVRDRIGATMDVLQRQTCHVPLRRGDR
jgi:hypothetical protein